MLFTKLNVLSREGTIYGTVHNIKAEYIWFFGILEKR